MKRNHSLRRSAIVVTLAALVIGVFTFGKTAAAGPQNAQFSQLTITAPDTVVVGAQHRWTRAEMRSAQAHELENTHTELRNLQDAAPQNTGEPGAIAGHLPDNATVADDSQVAASNQSFEIAKSAMAYYPYRTQGKLFFNQLDPADGLVKSYWCSASVLDNGAIMTAGHCVHNGRTGPTGWSTNITFVPAYYDGSAPYGQWSAARPLIFTAWYANRDFSRDVAGLTMLNNARGQNLQQVVGAVGIAYNWPANIFSRSFGYAAEYPFTGQRLRACYQTPTYAGGGSPATHGMDCNLNGGSSGGGWLVYINGGYYINGVNSYTPLDNNGNRVPIMYSPYFDTAVKDVIWGCVTYGTNCPW